MGYLLDTNVASELRKAKAAHPQLIAWSTCVDQSTMFLSVLVGLLHARPSIEPSKSRIPAWYMHRP